MNKHHTTLLGLATLISVFISIVSFTTKVNLPGQIMRLLLIPTTFFLITKLSVHLSSQSPNPAPPSLASTLLSIYGLVTTMVFIIAGTVGSTTQSQLITPLVFSPIALYFLLSLWPQKNLVATNYHKPSKQFQNVVPEKLDEEKRDFLKMLGAAGISVLLLNLFSKRAESYLPLLSPNQSDSKKPSEEPTSNNPPPSPTAGYFITEIDDSDPAYFGFTNSLGQWYIMREEDSNTYRYSKGDRDFTANWGQRATLKYDYFENVF